MKFIVCCLFPYFLNISLLLAGLTYEEYFYLYPLGYLPLFIFLIISIINRSERVNSKLFSFLAISSILSFPFSVAYQGLITSCIVYSVVVFIPWLSYFYLYDNERGIRNYMIYIVIYSLLHIIMIPFELVLLDRPTIMNLQYSGGQYYLFGSLLFMSALSAYHESYTSFRNLFSLLLIIIGLLSFSRVAIIITILYALSRIRLKKFRGAKLLFLIPVVYGSLAVWQHTFDKYGSIVLSRFNIYSNVTKKVSFDSQVFEGSNDRFDFYRLIFERNSGELFFGSGIGATEEALTSISDGKMGYGSLHNLLLTAIFERGMIIIPLLILGLLMLVYAARPKLILFLACVFFLGTGTDLFVNSKIFNIDFTIMISVMLVLYNEKRSQKLYPV